MRHTGKILTTLLLLLPFAILSCNKNTEGIIIVTKEAGSGADPSYPEKDLSISRIGIIVAGKTGDIKTLTKDFYSATAPDISFDGRKMLFTGRKTREDGWQIWEMDLGNLEYRQVTPKEECCIDPAYLPGNKLVFSKLMVNDSLKSHYSLFTCNTDGTMQARITFTPLSYRSSTVLSDGRILAVCEKVYPVHGKPELIALRPDGTKAELFYRSGQTIYGKAAETTSSKIIFSEKEGITGSSIISTVDYNRPLHTRTSLKGDLMQGIPVDDKWMVCCSKNPGERAGLYEYDKDEGIGKLIYSVEGYDVIYAVNKGIRPVPKKLPSEVDKLVKTGLLLCQDITVNGPEAQNTGKRAVRIEITGIDASYGQTDPETDGSVYLKVVADMPFRISTLDENGKVIRTCNWMSLRPNERRGCTGCHEDPEMVPENRIPLAVKKAPVIIPIHIEKITEKTVELE